MTGVLAKLFSLGKRQTALMDYEEAKRLAADANPRVRRKLAARDDVQPEILYFLAEDPEADVRREIAANGATPVQADLILAGDRDDDVRARVASKVAKLAPDLTEEERAKVGDFVVQILETLAQDQVPRVRQILSEELKDASNVPVSVIERLARDDVFEVAGPVLKGSSLLSDEFLIEIIESRPVRGVLDAIARRRGVGAGVSEAIVATDDEQVITALLSNSSAQIREETLDALVDQAPEVEDWHFPLVARPALSARAIGRLAGFVADSLLERLRRREDIDPETAEAVAVAVRDRLGGAGRHAKDESEPTEDMATKAKRFHAEGKLDAETIMKALTRGERDFVSMALALKADLTHETVQKAVSLQSAKGVTAIAWKAGLNMTQAVQLQLRLSRIAPSSVLKARNGEAFPLSSEEMTWQLEFFES